MLMKYRLPFSKKFGSFILSAIVMLIASYAIAQTGENGSESMKWTGVTGILLAFGAGIGLSFTPCLWPMYPIISSVIIGSSSVKSKKTAVTLSLVYILGMMLIYTILGALMGQIGAIAQSYLKSVWIVIAVSAILFIFGLSMLGLFEIQIPAGIRSRLMSGKHKGYTGVFVMGFLSGIAVSPCITPVVGGLFAFVAQSGSPITGAYMFAAFSLGMGVVLMAIGVASGALKTLPKPGPWMVRVKQAFGVIMIALSIYVAYPVVSAYTAPDAEANSEKPAETATSVSEKAENNGGSEEGADVAEAKEQQEQKEDDLTKVKWVKDLEKGLKLAEEKGKPALIDFFAEWCTYCHKLDNETFSDKRVIEKSRDYVMIKFDATKTTQETAQVLREFQVSGFPTLILLNPKTEKAIRIPGFVPADSMLKAMNDVAPKKQSDEEKTASDEKDEVAPSEISWQKDLSRAMKTAEEENKPVMIDFFTEWCTYCKKLDKETFSDQKVIRESERFIPVKFDATKSTPEIREVIADYNIVGYPTIVFIDSEGNRQKVTGFVTAEELLETMKGIE